MGVKTWLIKFASKQLGKKLKEGPMDSKKWYLSKTMWSNIVIVLIGTYELIKTHMVPGLPPIPPILLTILGAIGIYGRATATQAISR
jgi:hypothetical protein